MILRSVIRLLLCTAILPTAAQAGDFPQIAFIAMGYAELTRDALPPDGHQQRRMADQTGFLAITADLNGDGRDDEVRILANSDRGDAHVVAVIQSPDQIDTYVLNSLSFADRGQMGIQIAPPTPSQGQSRPHIVLFRFDGPAECLVFQGKEFEQVPMPADWTLPN